jgi:hypothetical protein
LLQLCLHFESRQANAKSKEESERDEEVIDSELELIAFCRPVRHLRVNAKSFEAAFAEELEQIGAPGAVTLIRS